MNGLKKLASHLPDRWQMELKRIHFGNQIKKGKFITDEPEFQILEKFISPGDWAIDIGANVGHYTKRMSELVGDQGRVIAFEPVPTTFSLLSANAQKFVNQNVSLFNVGVSDKLDTVGISIPSFSTGLDNFYQAHISPASEARLAVLTLSLDALNLPEKVRLIKIDAEGHEIFVVKGMLELIKKSRPTLIIETSSIEIINDMTSLGYTHEILKGSPNILFTPNNQEG